MIENDAQGEPQQESLSTSARRGGGGGGQKGGSMDSPLPSLDDILARHDLERKDLLFKCPRKINALVAEATLGDKWNLSVGRALNVSETKLKDIHHDISGPEDKAVATMDAWSTEYGERATCLKLIKAL